MNMRDTSAYIFSRRTMTAHVPMHRCIDDIMVEARARYCSRSVYEIQPFQSNLRMHDLPKRCTERALVGRKPESTRLLGLFGMPFSRVSGPHFVAIDHRQHRHQDLRARVPRSFLPIMVEKNREFIDPFTHPGLCPNNIFLPLDQTSVLFFS